MSFWKNLRNIALVGAGVELVGAPQIAASLSASAQANALLAANAATATQAATAATAAANAAASGAATPAMLHSASMAVSATHAATAATTALHTASAAAGLHAVGAGFVGGLGTIIGAVGNATVLGVPAILSGASFIAANVTAWAMTVPLLVTAAPAIGVIVAAAVVVGAGVAIWQGIKALGKMFHHENKHSNHDVAQSTEPPHHDLQTQYNIGKTQEMERRKASGNGYNGYIPTAPNVPNVKPQSPGQQGFPSAA